MRKNFTRLFILFALLLMQDGILAQTYSDGPIQLRIRVRDINVTYSPTADAALTLGGQVGFTPDELTFKVWAMDNPNLSGLTWQGGSCLTDNFNPPLASADFNTILFDHTYTTATVPQYFDLKLDAWQDNCGSDGISGITSCTGSRCSYESSCAGDFLCSFAGIGDNRHCDATPFKTQLDYRAAGPPCRWSSHGYVAGNCPSNNYYQPKIESFWRYTRGTACSPNDAIDLGTLVAGGTLTHFNSNECYSNNFTASPGNDVIYTFTINNPMGVTVSVCGATTTFDTYLYLLDNACNIDTFNDDGCSVQSVFSKALCNTGRYYIVVDGKQATSMGTFTLTVTENPNFSFSVSATKTDVSCAGGNDGTATATVSGGNAPYTYLWNDPSSQTTQTATGLLPGTYTVTVTDQDGCTTTASVTINEPAPLSVTTTATNVTCGGANDGTATANVSGGTPPYAYVWNTTPIQTLPTAIQLAAGTYFVTVTDANGCTASASATVNTTTSVVITTVNESDISCFGANDGSIDIDVIGGDPPYAYAWSHGPATQDVSGLAPGFYEVTVSDSLGCIAVQSYFITEPPLLNVQVQNVVDVLCNSNNTGGVDISVMGGTPPYTYAWSGGYTTEDLLSVPAGIYQVIVTDANGCQDTAQTVVDEPQPLVSSVTVQHPACADQMDGSADLTVSGGTPPYTYFWSNFQTTQDLANAPAGMYTVVITDANGCVRVDTATLLAPPEITVSVNITRPACNGADDGVIDLTVNGGTPPYQFQWSDGATTEDISGVAAGTYGVTVTDDDGCTVSESINVDEPEALQLQLTAVDVSCIGDSNGVVVASVTGGKSPYQYQWSGGLGNTAIIESLPPGDYALTVTDANGCSATGMAAVEEPAVDPEDCIAEEKYGVVVPNAFTPNGDGLNDRFEVVHIGARKIEMRIFNRWGKEIYYNPDVSTPGNGWDGKYEGKDVPVGSYAYLLNVEFWNGQNRKLVGSVTVVR